MRKRLMLLPAFIATFCAGGFLGRGLSGGRCGGVAGDTIVEVRRIHDTIRVGNPAPSASFHTGRYIPLVVERRDTVYLPVERKIYRDTAFYAEVSGYRPSLDSIAIFRNDVVETRIVAAKERRWGLGIAAGATATRHGISPGVTIGVTYTFKTW